ncbi:RNA methyltransferase [Metamycoplasma cloacale]|uniref:23S rRNA (Guanosine(2251)-2'-O)-methyltransferase RlmB n=1 Tax=Metamycoplasma cloacale TaxID=92401 RepID=A0A2Z4LMF6_9BACT|nr:23S rRNA (guanosine(2251)-2'-O)-methyltransferase RlmB [Metamycoplasma cloacale]AWX42963.1 23S rRNA (guanosine(2251)-2'-O)-methyltransferase RlmB [Metamycoplasma cloacale]VEU79213.1 RNA methyltransferase [Metamycoplasma cloacale]
MKQYIFGKNSVLDAIKNNFPIKTLYIQNNLQDKKINFPKIKYLSYFELNNLVKGNHQGYIAEIEDYQYHDIGVILKDKPENVLILDHIQDPQNFGAIIRSANVFGINHIIIPKNRACEVTPTVLKTSSGGFNNVKIIKIASLFEAIDYLKKNGFWIYATALNNQAKKLHQISFAKPTCLIVGNEESGVSNTLIKHADEVIYIEQFGLVQSLNVSVASGIAMYELTKKK